MITEEKLAELRNRRENRKAITPLEMDDLLDTLSALWRVAKAAEFVINTHGTHNWKGDPEKESYTVARKDLFNLQDALAALREGKEKL